MRTPAALRNAKLDVTGGQGSFVSASHLSAIERLGTRLENTFTAEEAMEKGLLGGWNVRKWPAFAIDPDTGKKIPKPGRVDVVRNNPVRKGQVDFLGEAGAGYTVIQNEHHAELLNALVDESGAHFELGGAVDGGRKVFLSMKLPGHINIGGVDPIENSILALNSHDGSMSFTLMVLPIRYACLNVLNCAFEGASHMIRVRHTSGAETAMRTQARQALDMSFNYLDHFQEAANHMIETSLTQSRFEEIVTREFGSDEDASRAAITRSENKINQMCELFADAMTQEGIRGTAWAGFNALTEWADHFSPTRGEDRDTARASKALLDPSIKNTALRLMTSI
jgi:phage/plasmid-like protein (TIGR03299 family)